MAAEPAQTSLPLHRLDVQTYNQIVAPGALEGRRVELLDGVLAQMSPQSPDHSAAIEALTEHFAGANARVRVALPTSAERRLQRPSRRTRAAISAPLAVSIHAFAA